MSFDHFQKVCDKYNFVYTLTSTAYNGVRLMIRHYDDFNSITIIEDDRNYSKLFTKAVQEIKRRAGDET